MNRNLLIFVIILTALVIALVGNSRHQKEGKLPWDITVFPDGRVHVLGITINQTTVQEGNQILGHFAEPRLYLDDPPRLMAVHDNIKIAGMSARLEMQYYLDESRITAIQQNATMSDDKTYLKLTTEQEIELLATPVVKLIYTPDQDYDAGKIEKRFGEPDIKQIINNQIESWTYNKLGLTVSINNNGPETFSYTSLVALPPLEPLPSESIDTANPTDSSLPESTIQTSKKPSVEQPATPTKH